MYQDAEVGDEEGVGSVEEADGIAVDGAAGEEERKARGRELVRGQERVGFGYAVE